MKRSSQGVVPLHFVCALKYDVKDGTPLAKRTKLFKGKETVTFTKALGKYWE